MKTKAAIAYAAGKPLEIVTLDLEGFRSGSMNAVLPVETLLKPTVS